MNLNERSKEISAAFPNFHANLATEHQGQPDTSSFIMALATKLTGAYASKQLKEKHNELPKRTAEEVALTEAYILALVFADKFGLILDSKKVATKKGVTTAAQIIDILSTLTKVGKANGVLSDHTLISSVINQILHYANRNHLDIEGVYEEMRKKYGTH